MHRTLSLSDFKVLKIIDLWQYHPAFNSLPGATVVINYYIWFLGICINMYIHRSISSLVCEFFYLNDILYGLYCKIFT